MITIYQYGSLKTKYVPMEIIIIIIETKEKRINLIEIDSFLFSPLILTFESIVNKKEIKIVVIEKDKKYKENVGN